MLTTSWSLACHIHDNCHPNDIYEGSFADGHMVRSECTVDYFCTDAWSGIDPPDLV